MQAEARPATVKERLSHEVKQYVAVSLYLYACFGAILLYKAAVLGEHGFGFTPYGLAAIKALVLGKFMLLGHAARVGARFERQALVPAVLANATLFIVLLVAATLVEEVVLGVIHGHRAAGALAEFIHGRLAELAASSLLVWMILLPYFAARQIRLALGEEAWRRLLSRSAHGPG